MNYSNPLQKAIEIGLCSILTENDSKITIRMGNPNVILRNLNEGIQRIWPDSEVKYLLDKFPIHLKILPDPELIAEEFVANTEDISEIVFVYNPKALDYRSAIEKGVSFFFNWLNFQMLSFEPGEQNLEQNWPYDPEIDQIRWILLDLCRKCFYSFDLQMIVKNPMEFCLDVLQMDPSLSTYLSNSFLEELMDTYPGNLPFLDQIKKIKTRNEEAKAGKNIKNLEPYSPLEG